MKRLITLLLLSSCTLIIGGCSIFSHYNSHDTGHGYYDESYELGGGHPGGSSHSGRRHASGSTEFPAVDYNPDTKEAKYEIPASVQVRTNEHETKAGSM